MCLHVLSLGWWCSIGQFWMFTLQLPVANFPFLNVALAHFSSPKLLFYIVTEAFQFDQKACLFLVILSVSFQVIHVEYTVDG